jgi:ferrochelatase
MSKSGVLLVNLGSPDSPSVLDVHRFLREFLMDGRVLDAPWPLRFLVVHCLILPFRLKKSAEAYRKIWTPEGPPLVVISNRVRAELQGRVGMPVELAMRYRNPSIESALAKLRAEGVDDLLLIPLFPHFAMSSYETAVVRVRKVAARRAPGMRLRVQPPFFADDDYIAALVASVEPFLGKGFDNLLLSFHGVPERHLRKTDPTKSHCLVVKDCCNVSSPAHATCFRHQCLKTVEAFAQKAGLAASRYSVAFQSRLGCDRWLQPYTDIVLRRLAARGVKRLLVICPAFVADCVEVLEEIGMRGRKTFLAAGSGELTLIPCLNDHPLWLAALSGMVKRAFAN